MIRLVLGEGADVAVDLTGRSFGRGAWVHARPDCLAGAARGGLAKSFRASVSVTGAALVQAVRNAADRRVSALLASARGAGRVVTGSDAAGAAFASGEAVLVVVARDARASAEASWVQAAGAAGKAIHWGDKESMGRATSRPDTGVLAITDRGLAGAIARAIALSSMPEPDPRRSGRDEALVEVR